MSDISNTKRSDRLSLLLQTLQDGALHRAADLARTLGVSDRTLYRDMDTLVASGIPVIGTRGAGYRLSDATPLPPMTLTPAELEVLQLGLALTAELGGNELRAASLSLAAKVDAGLPTQAIAPQDIWKFATYPFADTARGLGHMPTLRAAITARQKLRLTYTGIDAHVTSRTIRPLRLGYLGRIWTLVAWCELRHDFRDFRLDLIETAEALPALFTDEPGKQLSDR
ncbi:transcriptional regulator [Sulfitobacter sp. SK012]|uniref:helix-turn-helix transcriptional regulator n=1 Tax=Sulfitobacter sp. SK012 TaxID=1389005 RepID=UPI000E0CAA17|nr:YafY family protein [Sulfitobacter sp. SK012]AXI46111.1 transcriptional regulator [Sulfitobacter sp. SK012]